MLKITIEKNELTGALAALDGRNLADPALHIIGRTLVQRIDRTFKSAQSPWGDAWAPLVYRKGKPLQDTGLLRKSITYKVEGEGTSSPSVVIGSNRMTDTHDGKAYSLARIHQFGTTVWRVGKPRKGMSSAVSQMIPAVIPARPFFPLRSKSEIDLPASWVKAINRNLKAYAKTL